MANEMLGPILLSAHNLAYYQRLMADIRQAIEQGTFGQLYERKRQMWQQTEEAVEP
jgi:queuine tRNA-ribosyltransferase